MYSARACKPCSDSSLRRTTRADLPSCCCPDVEARAPASNTCWQRLECDHSCLHCFCSELQLCRERFFANSVRVLIARGAREERPRQRQDSVLAVIFGRPPHEHLLTGRGRQLRPGLRCKCSSSSSTQAQLEVRWIVQSPTSRIVITVLKQVFRWQSICPVHRMATLSLAKRSSRWQPCSALRALTGSSSTTSCAPENRILAKARRCCSPTES